MTTERSQESTTPEAWAKTALPHGEPWQIVLMARARETLEGNIVRCPAWGNRRGIVPAHNRYDGVWNWDSAFHALAVSRWDVELAHEQIEIMFDLQMPSGALPDVLHVDGSMVDESGKPPVFPWAIAEIDKRHPDSAFLTNLYPKLLAYETFWRRERGGDEAGLFHYGGKFPEWESGWDDSVRWDGGTATVWAIDLNAYMVTLYDAMAYIAGCLGFPSDAVTLLGRRETLVGEIERRLWSEEAQAYLDYDFAREAFVDALTPASFTPLFAGFALPARADAMAKHAADPRKFHPGMPTVAYDDPKYSSTYWRGPCWLNTAAFAIMGLQRYGHGQIAGEIERTVLERCYDAAYPFEYYDATTGEPAPGSAARFGWSAAFIIELLLGSGSGQN